MRFLILSLLLVLSTYANESVSYFKKSPDNKLLCHVGQSSFKMVSQKNAIIEEFHGGYFFKLINENFYFPANSCQPLVNKKEAIIF